MSSLTQILLKQSIQKKLDGNQMRQKLLDSYANEDKKKKAQELIAYLNGANMVPQNLNKYNNYKINTDKSPEATAARKG